MFRRAALFLLVVVQTQVNQSTHPKCAKPCLAAHDLEDALAGPVSLASADPVDHASSAPRTRCHAPPVAVACVSEEHRCLYNHVCDAAPLYWQLLMPLPLIRWCPYPRCRLTAAMPEPLD